MATPPAAPSSCRSVSDHQVQARIPSNPWALPGGFVLHARHFPPAPPETIETEAGSLSLDPANPSGLPLRSFVLSKAFRKRFQVPKEAQSIADRILQRRHHDWFDTLSLSCFNTDGLLSCTVPSAAMVVKLLRHSPRLRKKFCHRLAMEHRPAVLQTLRRRVRGLLPITAQGSKELRAQAASPLLEAGQVGFHHRSEPLKEELPRFPRGSKDLVDAFAHGALWLETRYRRSLGVKHNPLPLLLSR